MVSQVAKNKRKVSIRVKATKNRRKRTNKKVKKLPNHNQMEISLINQKITQPKLKLVKLVKKFKFKLLKRISRHINNNKNSTKQKNNR